MTKLPVLILFILLSFSALTQHMKITGTVYDSTGTNALPDAIIMAVRLRDSVLLGHTHSDNTGQFSLHHVPIDTFALIISHFKFDDRTYYIMGSAENQDIQIPSARLSRKSKELAEIVVYANKNPIYFRGDTLVYVADSFAVKENAVVEDLLKKLPGITVDENGQIKSQGKEISKVFVDGDEFFGTDPTIATKNLGADGIKTVEVYEKKNENAGEGEEETIQVLNLTLKEEAKKGFFGRATMGSDLIQFYEGEFLFNKFNNSQKFSIFLLSTNTPRSNFDWNDINAFGLDNESGWKMDEDGEWYSTGNQSDGQGIPQTLRTGIYFSDKFGKNKQSKINFNYTYTKVKLNSISQSFSQYFLSDSTYYTNDSTRTIRKNDSHTINLTFFSQLDSLTTLEIKPSIVLSNGNSQASDYSHFLTSESLSSRTNTIDKGNEQNGMNLEIETDLRHSFQKDRREIRLKHTMKQTKNTSSGTLNFLDVYYLGTNTNDTTNQLKDNQSTSSSQTARLTYSEPLTAKSKLEAEYQFDYSVGNQSKETRNVYSNTLTEIDSNYTNSFENVRIQHRIGLSFVYESKKHTLVLGARYRTVQIENKNLFTQNVIQQNVPNVLPRLNYGYKFSQTTRIQFKYNTNSRQPSVNALQPVPDNTNPNRIVVGNPALKPTYSHSGNLNFNSWNSLENRYIWIGLNSQFTNNAFADSTNYDSDGRQYSKTVNVDGTYWIAMNVSGGIGLYKRIIELGPTLSTSFSKNYSYIDGQRNEKTTQTVYADLRVNLNLDSLTFSVYSNLSYNSPKSSLNAQLDQPYTNQEYGAELNWTLPWWHLSLRSDVTYVVLGQRTAGYNFNYAIVNASLEKGFLKNQNLILSLQGNDLFNQNINAERSVSSNIITDYRTKIITRYYLVKLTFKFNNKKAEENEEAEP